MRGRDPTDPLAWVDAAREACADEGVLWSGGPAGATPASVGDDLRRFREGARAELPGIVGSAAGALVDLRGCDLVRDWYALRWPNDELGGAIDPSLTFVGALRAVELGGGFYDACGVADSVVRERVFEEVAARAGLPYDEVYDAWLHERTPAAQAAPPEPPTVEFVGADGATYRLALFRDAYDDGGLRITPLDAGDPEGEGFLEEWPAVTDAPDDPRAAQWRSREGHVVLDACAPEGLVDAMERSGVVSLTGESVATRHGADELAVVSPQAMRAMAGYEETCELVRRSAGAAAPTPAQDPFERSVAAAAAPGSKAAPGAAMGI